MHKNIEEEIEQFLGDADLNGKNVSVLVEDKSDMAFWERIINEFAPQLKPDFPIFLNPIRPNRPQNTGKGELVKYRSYVSKQLIVCADSDNDSYHQTSNSNWLNPRIPFIYQTYAHSRESHFIHPKNLEEYCFELVHKKYDFHKTFKDLSEALYEYLILWLFFTDDARAWLSQDISLNVSWDRLKEIISQIKIREKKTIEALENISVDLKETIVNFKERTIKMLIDNGLQYLIEEYEQFKSQCPISAEDTLWFIQGHCAFEDMILPYFERILFLLSSESKSCKDILQSSYRNCFSESRPCRFFDTIKIDFNSDFPILK